MRAFEEVFVDERLVWRRVAGAAVVDLAQVGAIAEDRQHGLRVEGLVVLRSVATLGQPAGERGRAFEPVGIAREDLLHEWCLGWVGFQVAALRVEAVAEGERAAGPLAAGRLAFHAGDHPLDDRRPFELGEDTEHLDHHPPGRAGGVERLAGAAKEHAGLVELLQQLREAAH
ncbi:MAG: hypothetical protein WAQ33_08670 [Gaiellaceae bacterium]